VFVSEKFERQQILDEIEASDMVDDDDILHENKRVRRILLLSDLSDMLERDTVTIKQKARADWFTKGDMNSKFFHSKLRWRRLNNGIKGIFINGEWCEDPYQVKIEVRKHFENRFQAQTKLEVNLDGVAFSRIDNVDNEVLCSVFSESEILDVVGQCGSSKSSGFDGYNFHF